mgnify:FL=1
MQEVTFEAIGWFVAEGVLWGVGWFGLLFILDKTLAFIESHRNEYWVYKHRCHGNEWIISNWHRCDSKEEAEKIMSRNDPVIMQQKGFLDDG